MFLQQSIFLSSSMAEHSAVNRVVVGSSPTWGAHYLTTCPIRMGCFLFEPRIRYLGSAKRLEIIAISGLFLFPYKELPPTCAAFVQLCFLQAGNQIPAECDAP